MPSITTPQDPAPAAPLPEGSLPFQIHGDFKGANRERVIQDEVYGQIDVGGADPAKRALEIGIDLPIFQRLRYVMHAGCARYVYPGAVHPRFSHSIGVAHLALLTLEHVARTAPPEIRGELQDWRRAFGVAALFHDLGHVGPGSHLAYQVFFPAAVDRHEQLAVRFMNEEPGLRAFGRELGSVVVHQIKAILGNDEEAPLYLRKLLHGGAWNIDRGDWIYRDSVHAGVSYGKYDFGTLARKLNITPDGDLAIRESGLVTLESFTTARNAMYQDVYYHQVGRIAEFIHAALVARARELLVTGPIPADLTMQDILRSSDPSALPYSTLAQMTEDWWLRHLREWREYHDPTLSDLARRLIDRDLFTRVEVFTDVMTEAAAGSYFSSVLRSQGLDPRYYLCHLPNKTVPHSDLDFAMLVLRRNGSTVTLSEASPIIAANRAPVPANGHTVFALPESAAECLRIQG